MKRELRQLKRGAWEGRERESMERIKDGGGIYREEGEL